MMRQLLPRRLPAWLLLLLLTLAGTARAQHAYLQPPADGSDAARCAYFSRLHRFTEESKRMCDDGRAVAVGPVTSRILAQCQAAGGTRHDQVPIDDMMEAFVKQVGEQGLGNACHSVQAEAWDLVGQ